MTQGEVSADMGIRRTSMRGQSMGEYAILFAIVLGAAIAMQQFVKARLQGAIATSANDYFNSVGNKLATFEPVRIVNSESTSNLDMTSVRAGAVRVNSLSNTNIAK